ncbi:urease accessory protein UreD [Bacillus sp. CECT 9360]|uniref:urease accessory protein UreD n=1 Tax=Bacillus sp. CECT 9360 TaxID=2845821 RepID=UPI001E500CC8|nr:urease accessory protein UreD [Bacillus sp. CECT 9360]CAH0346525.1 Urease accessory protein UreD [Bacillus sp. CECT 9360]
MDEWTGYAELETIRQHGRTILSSKYHYGSFKITHPLYLDNETEATLYWLSVGGGYVNGDTYRMILRAGEGSAVTLRTQGATKIYRTIDQPPIQENQFELESDASLFFMPEPTILYRDARFHQFTEIYMKKRATLFLTDILTPGWSPDGALFSYQDYRSVVKVFYEGELVVLDRLLLEPAKHINETGYLESYSHFGSAIVISDLFTVEGTESIKQLVQGFEGVRLGLSALPCVNGFCLRIFAHNTGVVEEIMTCIQRILKENMNSLE